MNLWPGILCVLLLTAGIGLAADGMDDNPLPIGFTEEELTRLHEIGMDHITTTPPTGSIRNSAEWERSQGVIIRYPFGISYDVIAEMSEDIMVTTIVGSSSQQSTVESWYTAYGVNLANCDWLIAPTNTYWTRDYAPWFIFEENGDMAIVDPIYNRPRPQDDVIPQVLGSAWGLNVFGMPLATPGGNHMSDGLGRSMSTELVYNENLSFSHDEVDSIITTYLGNDFTVLDYTESTGIHHIDVWAKFLSPTTILVKDVSASNSSYALLNARAEQLAQMTSAWGKPYTVVRVFCPTGAGYTNSIILNDKVLVPIVNDAYYDSLALQTYSDAMPGYEVLGFTGAWLYDDALHCRTMGVPDSNMLWIVHVPLQNQNDTINDYEVSVKIVDHSDMGLISDSLKVFYSINDGPFDFAPLFSTAQPDSFYGHIPVLSGINEVSYYIQAADNSGRVETHPFIGEPGAHKFSIELSPDLEIFETSIDVSLDGNDSSTYELVISNNGLGRLDFVIESEMFQNKSAILYYNNIADRSDEQELLSLHPTAENWLSVSPDSGSIEPFDSIILYVHFDAANLETDLYSGQILITSNDPDTPLWNLPVSLDVTSWICGNIDANGSGTDISDLVYLVDYMFNGGPPPPNLIAADINGELGLDISDLVYLVDYMFNGGPAPVCQ